MNPIASGLAGATGQGIIRFVAYGMVSAMMWAGTWIGLGYLLGNAVVELATRFGIGLLGALLTALLCVIVLQRGRRYRVLQALQEPGSVPRRRRHGSTGARESAFSERHVGVRLRWAGYARVRSLAGGLHAWQRRGYLVQATLVQGGEACGEPGVPRLSHSCGEIASSGAWVVAPTS